jgi:hypothetical protein
MHDNSMVCFRTPAGKAACDLRYLGTDQCHVVTEPGNTTNNDDCRSLVISADVCQRCYKRLEWTVRLLSGSFYRCDRAVSTDPTEVDDHWRRDGQKYRMQIAAHFESVTAQSYN